MPSLAELQRRLKAVDLNKVAADVVRNNEQAILDLNRDQLLHGQAATGDPIKPLYASARYAKKKAGMNSLPGFMTPDLRLTGNTYETMRLDAGASSVHFYNPDSGKIRGLKRHYGEDVIYGLTKQNIAVFRGKIGQPGMVDQICIQAQLKKANF